MGAEIQGNQTYAMPPGFESVVASAVSKALAEADSKRKVTNHMDGVPGSAEESLPPVTQIRPVVDSPEAKGLKFCQVALAVASKKHREASGDSSRSVTQILKDWAKRSSAFEPAARLVEAREKALTQALLTDGGTLVPEQFSAELIELLRNETAIRRLGPVQTGMPGGNLTIGRQSGAATAYYVGESVPPTTSKPATDRVRLSEKKLMAIVPVSNDLIRNASVMNADEFVRNDLIAVMGVREDLAFLRDLGTQDTPKGILYAVNATNKYNATAAAPKVPTLTEVMTEIAKARFKLRTANIKMRKLGWVISPRTEQYLMGLLNSFGVQVFANDIMQGRFYGSPLVVTNQIPENLGGGADESEIYFGDLSEFIIGDSLQMEVTVAPDAAYEEGGSTKAGFSRDETPIRVISKHDCALRHDKGFAVVQAVRWGAP